MSAPAAIALSTSWPSFAMSADRMEGAIQKSFLWYAFSAAVIRNAAGDDEARARIAAVPAVVRGATNASTLATHAKDATAAVTREIMVLVSQRGGRSKLVALDLDLPHAHVREQHERAINNKSVGKNDILMLRYNNGKCFCRIVYT